jgi:hypothetical protein
VFVLLVGVEELAIELELELELELASFFASLSIFLVSLRKTASGR